MDGKHIGDGYSVYEVGMLLPYRLLAVFANVTPKPLQNISFNGIIY